MVVSSVPPFWSPDWIKLPTVTTYRLTRPLTGAVTLVYSTSSWRDTTTALSAATLAMSTPRAAAVLSRSVCDAALLATRRRFRWCSCIAKGSWESACVSLRAVRVDYGDRARRSQDHAEAIRIDRGPATGRRAGAVAT